MAIGVRIQGGEGRCRTGRARHAGGRDLIQNWKNRGKRRSIREGFLEKEAVKLDFER